MIPVSLALLSPVGAELPLQLAHWSHPESGARTFVLTEASETFTFINVDAEPVPSILRDFSAPVVLEFEYTDAQLLHLLAHDTDPFNRWEAGQRLAIRFATESIVKNQDLTGTKPLNGAYIAAMQSDAPVGNLHRRAASCGGSAARARCA